MYMMHNFNILYIIYSLYCVLPISTLHMIALFGPYFTGLQWSRVYIVEMHNASNSSTWSCLERRKESRKESRFARRIVKRASCTLSTSIPFLAVSRKWGWVWHRNSIGKRLSCEIELRRQKRISRR